MEGYDLYINDKSGTIWGLVKAYALRNADHIEFNILYEGRQLDEFILKNRDSLVERGKKKNKLFRSGEYLRFLFSDNLKSLIENIDFGYFKNYCVEDVSFYTDECEIISTITHEDQIYLKKGSAINSLIRTKYQL
ncbi:hypothetical protein [Marinoscillum sp. 108]|uniref:hypothetical protein n=1 Tax=Marinoscillum sp. 108 TaxID=2653151 RepID=UPI0012F21FEE|nr:hypothetical protein [Marinoscillum sp. 108]VXD14801.1 hypothetical protein MARINOS108_12127 [Marinoscillum sp. 108]